MSVVYLSARYAVNIIVRLMTIQPMNWVLKFAWIPSTCSLGADSLKNDVETIFHFL